jgi:hypothetical protein
MGVIKERSQQHTIQALSGEVATPQRGCVRTGERRYLSLRPGSRSRENDRSVSLMRFRYNAAAWTP